MAEDGEAASSSPYDRPELCGLLVATQAREDVATFGLILSSTAAEIAHALGVVPAGRSVQKSGRVDKIENLRAMPTR